MNMPFSAASAGEVRRALETWLEHHGYGNGVVDDARLVMTELIGNAIRHAAPLPNGTLLVRWRIEDGRLLLTVCDGGSDTAPTRVDAMPDAVDGRGLAIVEALSSSWWVERTRKISAIHAWIDLR